MPCTRTVASLTGTAICTGGLEKDVVRAAESQGKVDMERASVPAVGLGVPESAAGTGPQHYDEWKRLILNLGKNAQGEDYWHVYFAKGRITVS